MPIRTHDLLRVLGDENRLRALLAVLERGEARPLELEGPLRLNQPTVSRALTALWRAGLLTRGNQRTPYRVAQPRDVRALIRAAALIEHAHTGNPDALRLAEALRQQDMRRGADEAQAAAQEARPE